MLEDRVFKYRKSCRFLGRVERIEGHSYMPFEVLNEATGRKYKGLLPITKLPASLKEGVLHIGRFTEIVPFELVNDWFKGVEI